MIRRLVVAVMTAVLSIVVAIAASIFSAALAPAASTTIFVQGTKTHNGPVPDKAEVNMAQWVAESSQSDFFLLDYPRVMWPVPSVFAMTFDASTAIGVDALSDAIISLPGEGVIYGHSQGAAVQSMLIESAVSGKNQNIPSADRLSFVMVSNPSRPNGGILSRFAGLHIPLLDITFHGPTPESEYKVIDISKQYDAVSDFPSRPFNVLALLNSALGYAYLHGDYSDIDLNDPQNSVVVSGNTTYITVPTRQLPLLQPVRDVLAFVGRTDTPVLDAIEPGLRNIIEAAYDRTTVEYRPAQLTVLGHNYDLGQKRPEQSAMTQRTTAAEKTVVSSNRRSSVARPVDRSKPVEPRFSHTTPRRSVAVSAENDRGHSSQVSRRTSSRSSR